MKTHGIVLLALFSLAPTMVSAQLHGPDVPDSLSFQGFLSDTSGVAVPDANYNLLFKMYKGSNKIWEENHLNVPVKSGGFNVILSGTPAYPLDTVAFNQPIDLGITVNGGTEMTPRTPLTSAAYALAMRGMYAVWAENGQKRAPNVIGGAPNNFVAGDVVGATIGGGGGWEIAAYPDSVLGHWGTIGGGGMNRVAGNFSTVGGGLRNSAGANGAVAGGHENSASGNGSAIGGGYRNVASGEESVVAGGAVNSATGLSATVSGGGSNIASGIYSVIIGGSGNKATGTNSAVLAGFGNAARGSSSVAAGSFARARHEGTFVWGDRNASPSDTLPSTAPNQFLIRATGGVGIGTNTPANQLSVAGNADISGSLGIGIDSPARLLHLRGSNSVVRVDREEGSGAVSILLHQYDAGTPDVAWKSFAMNVDADGVDDGTFKIQDLHTAVGGGGTVHDRLTIANNGDVTIPGNLAVTGTVSKGDGSFKIDHPLDPENKYLYHSFVESPDMKNVYDGNVVLGDEGSATIQLPSYFEALNREFRYQLTAIGGPGPNLYVADKVSGNEFSIAGGSPGMEVSWQITGVRKDPYAEQHRIEVEVDKPAAERGTYLHPNAYPGTN